MIRFWPIGIPGFNIKSPLSPPQRPGTIALAILIISHIKNNNLESELKRPQANQTLTRQFPDKGTTTELLDKYIHIYAQVLVKQNKNQIMR